MTDDLVNRLRALDFSEADEAADMIERLNRENDSLAVYQRRRFEEIEDMIYAKSKARAETVKEQRLIEFGGAVIGGCTFGGIVLLGTWLHGDFYMGLAWLFMFCLVTSVGELIIRAYRWAYRWWSNRNDR